MCWTDNEEGGDDTPSEDRAVFCLIIILMRLEKSPLYNPQNDAVNANFGRVEGRKI